MGVNGGWSDGGLLRGGGSVGSLPLCNSFLRVDIELISTISNLLDPADGQWVRRCRLGGRVGSVRNWHGGCRSWDWLASHADASMHVLRRSRVRGLKARQMSGSNGG
jgi:hypothetical protein